MADDVQTIRTLLSELASSTPRDRELAAEKVAGWVSSALEPHHAAVISRALDAVISLEDSETALEAQLNAIAEISALGLAPADSLSRVLADRSWDQPWAAEYIEGLRDDLPIAPTEESGDTSPRDSRSPGVSPAPPRGSRGLRTRGSTP